MSQQTHATDSVIASNPTTPATDDPTDPHPTATALHPQPTPLPSSFKSSLYDMHRSLSATSSLRTPLRISSSKSQEASRMSKAIEDDESSTHAEELAATDTATNPDPLTDLQYALEVGQYLLDQNQELEASVKAAKEGTDWLMNVMARMDPDVVAIAMAAVEEDGGDVRRRAEEANEVKLKIRSLEVQVDELKEQVTELTRRNTDLRMQNLELQMQQDLLKESAPSSTIAASLDARIKEYDTLVHQLKAQLSTSHHQLSALKSSGMRTPAETLSSPESRDSTFNTAGFRRLVPQSSSENLASTSLPHTPQPRRDNQISGLSSFQQHSITRQPSTESMASTTLSSLNHQSSTNSLHDDAWEIESNPHLQLQPVHNSALHHHHHLQQQPVQSLHHHTQTANPPSPIQTTNVNVIVHLMTGATLQKYNRRRTKSEPRFVSVNPYTRTISWSKTAPTMGGEVTTVFMRTVFVEDLVDGRSRIVVVGVGREYVFQCGSALEHAIWERGLTLVLQGAQGQGQPQVTVNTTAVGSSNSKGGLLKW